MSDLLKELDDGRRGSWPPAAQETAEPVVAFGLLHEALNGEWD